MVRMKFVEKISNGSLNRKINNKANIYTYNYYLHHIFSLTNIVRIILENNKNVMLRITLGFI